MTPTAPSQPHWLIKAPSEHCKTLQLREGVKAEEYYWTHSFYDSKKGTCELHLLILVFACMFVLACMCVSGHVCVCTCKHMCACVCICVKAYVHVLCMKMCTCLCVCVYTYVCVFVFKHEGQRTTLGGGSLLPPSLLWKPSRVQHSLCQASWLISIHGFSVCLPSLCKGNDRLCCCVLLGFTLGSSC